MEDFSVTVTGDEIPEESILLQRLQEALKQGTTRVNIINGYVVDTDSSVRLSVGPVLGEITSNNAIMMIEVTGKTDLIPIIAKLYREDEKGEPIDVIEKEAHANRPLVFLNWNHAEHNADCSAILIQVLIYADPNCRFAIS